MKNARAAIETTQVYTLMESIVVTMSFEELLKSSPEIGFDATRSYASTHGGRSALPRSDPPRHEHPLLD